MLKRKYYNEGDAGGTGDEGAVGDAAVEYNGPVDADGSPDYKAFFETTYAKDIAPKIKEYETVSAKYEELKSTVGKQGNDLKAFKDIQKAFTENPREYLRAAAKQAGLGDKFAFTDEKEPELDIASIMEDELMTPEQKNEKINQFLQLRDKKTIESTLKEIEPVKRSLMIQELKSEFKDWDDFGEARDMIMQQVKSRAIPLEKMAHLAVQATKIPDVIKDAEKVGYDKAIKEITKKMEEGIDVSEVFPRKKEDKKEREIFNNVLSKLQTVR